MDSLIQVDTETEIIIEMARYTDIPVQTTDNGTQYYINVRYPEIPVSFNDIYVRTTEGDRFDTIAQQYYSDSSLWWVISTANRELNQSSYYITPGTQIRIPSNIATIVAAYENANS